MTKNSHCRSCGSQDLTAFLELGEQSLAGGYLRFEEITSEKKYDLSIYVCDICALVQIVNPIDTSYSIQ